MLNKELVSFETAKLAKELGFDYNCIYTWCEKGGWNKYKQEKEPIRQVLRTNGNPFGSYFGGKNWNASKTSTKAKIQCSAPTQSELQRWLREVHNIHVEVNCVLDKHPNVKYYCNYYDVKNYVRENLPYLETYEQSLDQGLIEALKLITNENSNRSKTKD